MTKTSFLPEDYVEKKSQRRTNIISLSLFVVVMSSIIGAFLVTDRQRAEVYDLQYQVNTQFEEAAKRLEQLDDLQLRKEEMLRKARVTAMLIERVPRSLILAELINQMPSTLSLLELGLTTKVIKNRVVSSSSMEAAKLVRRQARKKGQQNNSFKSQAIKTDVLLSLVGVAPTDIHVAQFMTALSRAELFDDVNLEFSEEVNISRKHLMRKFRIDLRLNQDIDIQSMTPTRVRRQLKQNPMSNIVQIDADGQLVIPSEQLEIIPAKDRTTVFE